MVPQMVRLLIISVLLFGALNVSAQNKKNTAKAKFKAGVALYEAENYEKAAETFKEAYKIKPSWKLLYNIAQSEAAAKHYGLALMHFEQYLSEGGDDVTKVRYDEIKAEITRLQGIIGYLTVEGPDGYTLFIDGTERGTLPLPGSIPVAAGIEHTIIIQQNDDVFLERTVLVNVGQTVLLEKDEVEASTPDTFEQAENPQFSKEAAEPKAERKPILKVAGWVTLVTGVAALAGGTATAVIALSKEDYLNKNCPGGNCNTQKDLDEQERRNKFALATDILLPVGGTLAAAGITMLIVDLVKGRRESKEEVSLEVTPLIMGTNTGLFVRGEF